MKTISEILQNKKVDKGVAAHNKYEFQAYGNKLADELNDIKHRALYIKLAKTTERTLLEKAREFVLNSENATTKGKLFMWKLQELKKNQLNPTQKYTTIS